MPSLLYLGEPFRWLYEALPKLPWAAPEERPAGGSFFKYWKGQVGDICRIQALRLQVREEAKNATGFTKILVNSLYSRETLLRAYGIESTVCYLGVDTELFKPSSSPPSRFVIGMGGLDFTKGPDRAIRAVGAIEISKRPDLIWVTNFHSQQSRGDMEMLAAELGVRFKVECQIPDHEVVSLLSRASLMIYTSRLEPFGLAPLEANACGTPVVGIAEGGVRESIREGVNGLLVEGDSPSRLAEAMLRILNDASFSAALRTRALDHVREHWDIRNAVDRFEAAVYEVATAS
jgi:glycosyltransferase involved in cell wall biosynthesis